MKRIAAVWIILSTAACGGEATSDTAPEQGRPAVAVPTTRAPVARADIPYQPLSRETISRWMDASNESNRIAEENPELADEIDFGSAVDAEDAVARIRLSPALVEALEIHDFTPEQFVGVMQTMSDAMEVHGLRQAGQSPELPPHVREHDVRFIADNSEWLTEQWSRTD